MKIRFIGSFLISAILAATAASLHRLSAESRRIDLPSIDPSYSGLKESYEGWKEPTSRLPLNFEVDAAMQNNPTDSKIIKSQLHSDAWDNHSYSQPNLVRMEHVDLDLTVDFARKVLSGTATLQVKRAPNTSSTAPLMLDTRELTIKKIEESFDGTVFQPAGYSMGDADPILGKPLSVAISPKAAAVRIEYETSPNASGLQWLSPEQTAGGQQPFMFSQSEAIHARSWIPIQDTPGVRITYSAKIHVPAGLKAVMSAENNFQSAKTDASTFDFRMTKPIPSYLMALAVGDIRFQKIGPRTGIYAEPKTLPAAAKEFEENEKMIEAGESLFGKYNWGRYDMLILPPSFPYGGMENPLLTFLSPTVITGDKSLVSVADHEAAHSWSGNLVTNATWNDFWLNEGLTVYAERRMIEKIYGRPVSEMQAVLGLARLKEEMAALDPKDQTLKAQLDGRDPDDGVTSVPYEKGYLFFRLLEETFGRETFDLFLRAYMQHFSFKNVTTESFTRFMKQELLEKHPELAGRIALDEWFKQPGLPASAPKAQSELLVKASEAANNYAKGKVAAETLPAAKWTSYEWQQFLESLPKDIGVRGLEALDRKFRLSETGNAEIALDWFKLAIQNGFEPAYPQLEHFLKSVGRMKFIEPLYEELARTPDGRKRAQRLFDAYRGRYHPIARKAIEKILASGDISAPR